MSLSDNFQVNKRVNVHISYSTCENWLSGCSFYSGGIAEEGFEVGLVVISKGISYRIDI